MGRNVFSYPWVDTRWNHQKLPSVDVTEVQPVLPGFRYKHPGYDEARRWCDGPAVKGRFSCRWTGEFSFQDPRDAMLFKLTWT